MLLFGTIRGLYVTPMLGFGAAQVREFTVHRRLPVPGHHCLGLRNPRDGTCVVPSREIFRKIKVELHTEAVWFRAPSMSQISIGLTCVGTKVVPVVVGEYVVSARVPEADFASRWFCDALQQDVQVVYFSEEAVQQACDFSERRFLASTRLVRYDDVEPQVMIEPNWNMRKAEEAEARAARRLFADEVPFTILDRTQDGDIALMTLEGGRMSLGSSVYVE